VKYPSVLFVREKEPPGGRMDTDKTQNRAAFFSWFGATHRGFSVL